MSREAAALALFCALAACRPVAEEGTQAADRFAALQELQLFDRSAEQGGPFFLARFELRERQVPESVWEREAVPAESDAADLPVVGLDLATARRIAAHYFCRLPREDEWRWAASVGGAYVYPWGNQWMRAWANTRDLGLGRRTLVGTFEAGRSPGGPYDLIGNVAEWTETVPVPYSRALQVMDVVDRVLGVTDFPIYPIPDAPLRDEDGRLLRLPALPTELHGAMPLGLQFWMPLWSPLPRDWLGQLDLDPSLKIEVPRRDDLLEMPGVAAYLETSGLRVWMPAWVPAPTDWLVPAEDSMLERRVVGGDFRRGLSPVPRSWLPRQRGDATGMRLAAGPGDLLDALLQCGGAPQPAGAAALRRFLSQPGHLRVMQEAWQRRGERSATPIARLLASELGG